MKSKGDVAINLWMIDMHTKKPESHTVLDRAQRKQKDFTLIELLIVIALITLLAVFGIPFARSLIIEGNVEPTASSISKTATKIRANFAGAGTTPYTNLGSTAQATALFANLAREIGPALTVSGTGTTARVTHEIGASNAAVTVASTTLSAAGDSFSVTVANVNNAACPGLATNLSRSAERITVNGTTVKAVGGAYNPAAAQNACNTGDVNNFVFTFR